MNGAAVPMPASRGTSMTLRLARDDRLARLAASGDSRAFAVIYERYHQPIYRYCHSILHDPDDAADALQNAMLKAMRGLVGSERDIALKPWLFRIAHNEAISLVRRRRPTALLEAADEPSGHSADEDAATRERLTQLVEDLRELPDRQRGALLMRELAGLGFEEIAEIFDVSAAAAKQTVYEARTALHEYADGRQMRCEDARESLSAGDRRMLRGRKLAAHLRDCAGCRDFQQVMRLRSRDVAGLAPPISAGASAAILQGIVGAGAGGGAGGGGLLAWATGSGVKAVLGSEAAKSLVAAALVTAPRRAP
jgi:RNA polymerase sigma factor (sigma-70 family)